VRTTRIRRCRDFWTGILFIMIGGAFTYLANSYDIGVPEHMGPGFFPTMLGIILGIVGFSTVISSLIHIRDERIVDRIDMYVMFMILGSIATFAMMLPWFGLVLSIILLIATSSCACRETKWKETLIAVIILLSLTWIVFVKFLNIQIPIWPTFLT